MKIRQLKKIIKKDWCKKGIDFINGNKIDIYEALSWIEENLLKDFELADMSWIVYVGNDSKKDYDQSIDYCPDCAEKKIKELVESGEFKEGELAVRVDNAYESDGCETCDICGIELDCCSLGTLIGQELDQWEDYGCDMGILFNLVQTGASQIVYNKDDKRTEKMLLKFFQTGEYQKFYSKGGE